MWAAMTIGSGSAPAEPSKSTASKEQKQKRERPPKEKRRLSFKETRELEALPQTIESLEKEKRRLMATLNSPQFYINFDATKLNAANARLEALEKELAEAYHLWDELESLVAKLSGEPG